jgi:hypothetical protein
MHWKAVAQAKVIVEGFVDFDFDFEITLLTVRHRDGTSFCARMIPNWSRWSLRICLNLHCMRGRYWIYPSRRFNRMDPVRRVLFWFLAKVKMSNLATLKRPFRSRMPSCGCLENLKSPAFAAWGLLWRPPLRLSRRELMPTHVLLR